MRPYTKELGKSQADAVDAFSTLCQVQQLVGSMAESEKFAADKLHEGAYSKDELEGKLGTSLEALFADSAASLLVLKHNTAGFKLRDRAVHVYSEAARVHAFAAACSAGASPQTLGGAVQVERA